MPRFLIINGDDFGRTPGVSRGILDAHRRGIVTSTTALMNMPAVEEALAWAGGCPDLGVGVHLVFTSGRPLLPPEQVPTLVDREGRFYDQRTALARADQVDPGQLRAEFAAQIERFIALTGHLPDHLDCHHFTHLHPRYFAVYLAVAADYGLPVRNPLPSDDDLAAFAARGILPGSLSLEAAQALVARDRELLVKSGVRHQDHFIGAFFGDDALSVEFLVELLAGLPEGTSELMTHPGYADDRLRAESGYADQRDREVAILTDPRVRRQIEALSICLITYGALDEVGRGEPERRGHTGPNKPPDQAA